MRASQHVLVAALLSATLALQLGCNTSTPAESTPSEEAPSSTTRAPAASHASTHVDCRIPADDDAAVILRAGDLELTLTDYEQLLLHQRLRGASPSPRQLADASFQHMRLNLLLRWATLVRAAAARDLHVTPDALEAFLQQSSPYQALAKLDPQARAKHLREHFDTSPEVFEALLCRDVLLDRYTQALLDDIDDARLWSLYRDRQTTFELQVVRVLNVPSSQEISYFVTHHGDDIEAYYDAHRNQYRMPETRTIRRFALNIPKGAEANAVETIKNKVETFRTRAHHEDLADLVRNHSEDLLSKGKEGLMIRLTRQRFPKAFDLIEGQLSEVQRGRHDFSFFRLETIHPPFDRELDAGLRREIASRLLQEQGAVPSASHAAQKIQDALAKHPADHPEVAALIDTHRAELIQPPPFMLGSSGRIPKIGMVPAVHRTALTLDVKQPTPSEPILDGEYLYTLRLIRRQDASKTRFEAVKDHFRTTVFTEERDRIAWRDIGERMPKQVQNNLRPIQARYGYLQRDGSIRKPDPSP